MIRDAKYSDIPAMIALLVDTHHRSKYAGRANVCPKAADQMLLSLVAGQKQNGPMASFVKVVQVMGEVVGFMAGTLSRVYNIGDKLVAADIFLINKDSNLKQTMQLIDAYIEWARSNPKVIEIGLSWSDAMPSGKAVSEIYKRKGATMSGEQYTIRLDDRQMEWAA